MDEVTAYSSRPRTRPGPGPTHQGRRHPPQPPEPGGPCPRDDEQGPVDRGLLGCPVSPSRTCWFVCSRSADEPECAVSPRGAPSGRRVFRAADGRTRGRVVPKRRAGAPDRWGGSRPEHKGAAPSRSESAAALAYCGTPPAAPVGPARARDNTAHHHGRSRCGHGAAALGRGGTPERPNRRSAPSARDRGGAVTVRSRCGHGAVTVQPHRVE